MQKHKARQLRSEAKKFGFVGGIATVLDYALLNLFVGVFHLPVIGANAISTTLSSFVSYRLNKQIVFEGRRHGRQRTVLMYVFVIATGIYVIQNGLLLLFQKPLMPVADALTAALYLPISSDLVDVNLAKMASGAVAGIWNYLMLRHFVFVPETQRDRVEPAG